jgi:hypothetical protein
VKNRYSRQGLWSLFLICAIPLQIWAFVLAFRDFSWVTARTNAWDAIGVLAYGLIFALFEGVVVFLVMVLLGFLVSRYWDESRRIALLSALVLIMALWAIAGQIYFLAEASPPPALVEALAGLDHPVRVMYAGLGLLVAPTVLIPTYLVLKSDRAYRFTKEMTNRLGLLMVIYLILDAFALVVIVIRNL